MVGMEEEVFYSKFSRNRRQCHTGQHQSQAGGRESEKMLAKGFTVVSMGRPWRSR